MAKQFVPRKPLLRVIVIGSPGHGRSTVVHAVRCRAALQQGKSPPDRQIPLDVRAVWDNMSLTAETPRHQCIFLDKYGHVDPIPRMIGDQRQQVIVLVVSAVDGPSAELADAVWLASLTGIEHFVICLTNIDRVTDPAWVDLVEANARQLMADAGIPADEVPVIPGDFAIACRELASQTACVDELIAFFDAIPTPTTKPEDGPFRFAIAGIDTDSAGVWVGGRVVRGRVRVGDRVEVVGLGSPERVGVVADIEMFSHSLDFASAGDFISMLFRDLDGQNIRSGQSLHLPGTARTCEIAEAAILIQPPRDGGPGPLWPHDRYDWHFDHGGVTHRVRIRRVRRLDGTPLEHGQPGECVRVECQLVEPLAVEPGDRFELHGQFGDLEHRALGIILSVGD